MADEPVPAPPPPVPAPVPVPVPPQVFLVPALYVPKSVTYGKETDGSFTVKIHGLSVAAYVALLVALFMAISVWPLMALTRNGKTGLILVLIALGLSLFLFIKGSPALRIARDGVRIGSSFYAMPHIQDFREGSDDSWFAQFYAKLGLQCVGIQYGIYLVKTPYLLSKVESLKVAPFLTKLLRSVSDEIGKERERKIQQSQVF